MNCLASLRFGSFFTSPSLRSILRAYLTVREEKVVLFEIALGVRGPSSFKMPKIFIAEGGMIFSSLDITTCLPLEAEISRTIYNFMRCNYTIKAYFCKPPNIHESYHNTIALHSELYDLHSFGGIKRCKCNLQSFLSIF